MRYGIRVVIGITVIISGLILALTLFPLSAQAQDEAPAEEKKKEPKYGWEGSFNLGLAVTTGNSKHHHRQHIRLKPN